MYGAAHNSCRATNRVKRPGLEADLRVPASSSACHRRKTNLSLHLHDLTTSSLFSTTSNHTY